MKNFKSLLKFFIGLLIIILSILIWPIIRFKFGILIAERIGHLANTFDNYIYSRNSRGNFEFAIFHINSSISNTELLRLWKINQKRIIFSNLAKIVIHTSRKFKLGKKKGKL